MITASYNVRFFRRGRNSRFNTLVKYCIRALSYADSTMKGNITLLMKNFQEHFT
jgi:hypothetical protein